MPQWTKKAAIERMNGNEKLQAVYERYPLARLLVESAAQLKRHEGYHRIASHYAYKDWMWAAIGHENEAYWTCIHVIDDLLPPDNGDLGQGVCRYTDNPRLPGLPDRPERVSYKTEDGKYKGLKLSELKEATGLEKQRHLGMRDMLQQCMDKEKQR